MNHKLCLYQEKCEKILKQLGCKYIHIDGLKSDSICKDDSKCKNNTCKLLHSVDVIKSDKLCTFQNKCKNEYCKYVHMDNIKICERCKLYSWYPKEDCDEKYMEEIFIKSDMKNHMVGKCFYDKMDVRKLLPLNITSKDLRLIRDDINRYIVEKEKRESKPSKYQNKNKDKYNKKKQ